MMSLHKKSRLDLCADCIIAVAVVLCLTLPLLTGATIATTPVHEHDGHKFLSADANDPNEQPMPAPAVDKTEPQVVKDDSGTYLTGTEAQAEPVTVETPKLRSFGVMGTAAVSLGGLMLVVVLGTLAVSRNKK